MLWWATCVHFSLGLLLRLEPSAARAIGLSGLHHLLDLGVSTEILSYVLMMFSVIAAAGLVLENRLTRIKILGFLFPQYCLMLTALISIVYTVTAESLFSATGQPITKELAAAVLVYAFFGSVFHTFSIVERYFVHWSQ